MQSCCINRARDERPQVGDMFVYSWGYDQTNVDAFQVVRVTEKSMWLRAIRTADVPGTQGFMCSKVVPLKDAWGEEKSHRVPRLDAFAMRHGLCKRHVAGATYYNSWYA